MSKKIIVKSSSNQRSDPEQIMAHDAGTSRLCKECWDVQFATICCLSMPSSAVIQLLGYSAQEKDSLIRSIPLHNADWNLSTVTYQAQEKQP